LDPFDLDEDEEVKSTAKSSYHNSVWRPQIAKRLVERFHLVWTWLRLTILPKYGVRAVASMLLITAGRLGDAASFVVAIHILSKALSADQSFSDIQGPVMWAAAALTCTIAAASAMNFVGYKLAIRLVLLYENDCFAQGVGILRQRQASGSPLSPTEAATITKQAPRMMSRSFLQIINLCTSGALMVAGLAVCAKLFPGLTAVIMLALTVLSPLYVLAALYSTNIGHRIVLYGPGFQQTKKRMEKKWIASKSYEYDDALSEIGKDDEYNSFHEAYGARLALSARNHLLSSLTLAVTICVSLFWLVSETELSPANVTGVISFLVFLRVFANGLSGVFNGIQNLNTFIPFYLLYLRYDDRFKRIY
jgi:hypothetical protein